MAVIKTEKDRLQELNRLFDQLAAEVGKTISRRGNKSSESLQIRHNIGKLAEEDRRTRFESRPTKALAKMLGRSESDLLHHRQFYRLTEAQPELLEKWIKEGLPWAKVVADLKNHYIPRSKTWGAKS